MDSLTNITSKKIIDALPTEVIDFLSERALKSRTVYVVMANNNDESYCFWVVGITFTQRDAELMIIRDMLQGYLDFQDSEFDEPLEKYKEYIVNDEVSLKMMDFETQKQLVNDLGLKFIKNDDGYSDGDNEYKISAETFSEIESRIEPEKKSVIPKKIIPKRRK